MRSKIIPTLRYHDANAALEWLCDRLGFEEHAVHRDSEGMLVHAQLVRDGDMIMIGSMRADAFGSHVVSPRDVNYRNTQSPYLIIEDVAGMYQDLVDQSVEIAMPFRSEDYGGASFSVKDPEGNLWNFGSYDPWSPVTESE